jgi:hypothetical protein
MIAHLPYSNYEDVVNKLINPILISIEYPFFSSNFTIIIIIKTLFLMMECTFKQQRKLGLQSKTKT